MPPDLQIFLLGSFRLRVKNSAVSSAAWQKRKAQLLVQILALQPMYEAHREELIEILFPETGEKKANANFYRVLYAARRALEPERAAYLPSNFVVADGQKIKLAAANGLWIDAEDFEQKAREGLKLNSRRLLESAAALYTGDLMADQPFENWAVYRREQLRMLFHRILQRLAEITEKTQELEESHFWLDKILRIEPADETAHRAKIRLYCRAGERLLALRQYEQCAEVLRRELAVEPDTETERLRRKIIAGECD